VNHVPVRSTSGAGDSGLSLTDPNPHRASITLYLKLANGGLAAMPLRVDSTLLTTGAVLPIDGKIVDGSFVFIDGVTTGGFLEVGELKIYSAWVAPGGRVCGTFQARTSFFTNQDLAKKHLEHRSDRTEGAHVPQAQGNTGADLHAHAGEVVAQCLSTQ
jgi:hypothetical protein